MRAALWERPQLRRAAGDTLRPGGLELTDRAALAMDLRPGMRVLDVGCGLGATVARLRSRYGVRAWGVDASAEQLEAAGNRRGLVRAEGDRLPFPDGCFHAVFCECVLSLLPDEAAALAEFARVLAPGGHLALADLCVDGRRDGRKGGRRDGRREGCAGGCADRARPLGGTVAGLERLGISVLWCEDHTRHLRDLAARLVLTAEDEDDGPACGPHAGQGLGYYLLLARKREIRHG